MASREFQTLNKQPKKGEQMNNKAAIQFRVDCLNKALGRPLDAIQGNAPHGTMTDAFYVDKDITGYRLETKGNPVFGHQRMTKPALVNQLDAILAAIRLARNENTGSFWPSESVGSIMSTINKARNRKG